MIDARHDMTAQEVRGRVGADPIILEIGAHDGSTTAEFLRAMPECRVLCFEPDPRPLKRLRERFAGDERVAIRPWAIGAINGTVPWYASHGTTALTRCHDGDWDCSSSFRRPTHHLQRSPEITFESAGEVACRRLDDVVTGIIDFAWIDVQGAQRDVIEGGRKTLDEIPYIYIELHYVPEYDGEPNFAELCALLPEHEPLVRYTENILFGKRCTP
jgi:FkbM family methyltransferase